MAEAVIRVVAPQNLSGTWRIDTDTGLKVNKSSGTARHQFGERVVTYRFFEPHLRGTAPKDGPQRVLVLGDSFTFGWLLDAEDTFVAHLQRYADAEFGADAFQFLNAACGGWGTGDYVAFVEEHAARIEPDLLLVFFSFDDIGRSMKRSLYTFADEEGGALQRVRRPASRLKRAVNALFFYQWLLEHSHLVQFARNAAVILTTSPGHPRPATPSVPAGSPAGAVEADSARATRLGRALFRRLKAWSDRHGAAPYVIAVDPGDPALRSTSQDPTGMFLAAAPAVFGELDIPYFDASPGIWARKRRAPGRYELPGDLHPNEAGARLIAEEAWPFVRTILSNHRAE
ncbi:MAG: SGNH/GDSL hydrolase family protein [Rhodothermales bacterium]|nr:SGNH/GDSL hydrolase family protein [Rhodothermales bacterium]